MEKLKSIQNSIEKTVSKNYQASINKLSNNNKQKIKDITLEESSYLFLILYILLILFVSITLIIIIQGDKYNPYNIPNKFSGDINRKTHLSFWDKLYFLIFGKHKVNNKFESRTEYLDCVRSDYPVCFLNKVENSKNKSLNSKYKYLESFYNVLSNIGNNNLNNNFYKGCNNSSYLDQFEESRKCLINNTVSKSCNSNNDLLDNNDNSKCKSKYSYLDLELY